ncbi:MAG: ABC transporter substrate-binding protein [Anaerocolumna sp.]
MKKLFALLVVLTMIFGIFTACGNKENSSTKETNDTKETTMTGDTENSIADDTEAEESTEPFKIAIIQHVDHPSLNQIRETIMSELESLGYGEDKVVIEYQNANGDMTLLPTIIQNMIGNGVDMLIPIATSTAQAAMAATTTVPIVFSAVSDPVAAGLVTSFKDTTGNITGVSNSIPIEDIFNLALEMTPEARTFGFVYNTSEINSVSGIEIGGFVMSISEEKIFHVLVIHKLSI